MICDNENLKNIDHKNIFTTKRKDEAIKIQNITYKAQCPYFGFFYPCISKILKNHCPYEHIEDVRKAFKYQEDQITDGLPLNEDLLKKIAAQNCTNEEQKIYRIGLVKKYPEYPNKERLNFMMNIINNPMNIGAINRILKEDKERYKIE